jgi:ribosomal protein L28
VTYGVILYLWVATAAAPYVTYKQWQPAGEFVSLRACAEAIKTLGVSDKEARCVLNYTTQ